jgi:murein DD-endopeptidase MepM/ murein hydrolase activator NlpD
VSDTYSQTPTRTERWLYWGAWALAIGLLVFASYLVWQLQNTNLRSTGPAMAAVEELETNSRGSDHTQVRLPDWQVYEGIRAVSRRADYSTIIPNRPRQEITFYAVQTGDSVFAIANRFGITPESVLWANYDLLNDNPDRLTLEMELKVPPVDGVLYEWKEGDTIEGVAANFEAKPEDIIDWPGNNVDLINPQIDAGKLVMVPGGKREFRQWLVPTIPRGRAGVSKDVLGAGACAGGYEGAYGTGTFIWPSTNRYVVGNDYWSGHLAIDIGAGMGAPIYAADSGVVVFSGAAFGGYGNMIMIDHGNGYQTLYAHLSQVSTYCGQSVSQGQLIGLAGSTGNSTGPHLHFEIRYLGGFINPWFVLPAP